MTEKTFFRGSIATALAVLGIAVYAGGAAAECMDPPPSRDADTYVGYAFTATVKDVSHDTDPPRHGNAPFDWRVALDAHDVYRGSVVDPLVLDGWDVGCSSFYGAYLHEGDELFISVDRLDPDRNPSLYGDVLVWRATDRARRSGRPAAHCNGCARSEGSRRAAGRAHAPRRPARRSCGGHAARATGTTCLTDTWTGARPASPSLRRTGSC